MDLSISKQESIYNKSIGDMETYLVWNKLLPIELSLYHCKIVLNIETVNFNDIQDKRRAREILYETYAKLKDHWKFKDKLLINGDEITIIGDEK